MKAGYDARIRAKREKEKDKEEREAEEKKEVEERERDLGEWAGKLRKEQEALMSRIKDRARRKAALSDRKSALAQARMKNIATLAADDRVPKKKRKAGGGESACDHGLLYRFDGLQQRICSELMMKTGPSIAKLCVTFVWTFCQGELTPSFTEHSCRIR